MTRLAVEPAACVSCGARDGFSAEATGTDYLYHTTDDPFTFVRCGACGHLFLHPRPTSEAAADIYPANYYTKTGLHQGGWLGRLKDRVVTSRLGPLLQELPKRATVLDVGCGDAAMLLALRRRHPGLRLIGIDVGLTGAQQAALEAEGIEVHVCLAEEFEPPPGAVDLIVMNQIIEHLWDVRGVLARMAGALRAGGLISISTPDPDGYDRALFADGTWGGYYIPRHLNLFTRPTLARLLGEAGLDVCWSRPLVAPLIWIGSLQGALDRRRSRWARRLTDRNVALLAAFTAADLVAMLVGRSTSNQQIVARRRETS